MNEEQIAQEVAWINDENKWPLWPVLPVKTLGVTPRRHGIITTNHLSRVYDISIVDFKSDVSIGHTLLDVPYTDYESVEAMVREGWVGD
jgi:hypothetical protein